MKQILLFGAGKSATVLIEYLLAEAGTGQWELTVVDANLDLARSKIGASLHGRAASFDIHDDSQRARSISSADLVISMLPPTLHSLVARDCIRFSRHLLTASYVDPSIRELEKEIQEKGLLFLCEMGLDPGIDHMSAMKIIDRIRGKGGHVHSFRSHCGGLVAPESDDNPWHYKISWNPRNIVLAGKSGAVYRENQEEIKLSYAELFAGERTVEVPGWGNFGYYPNRDSLSYTRLYGLEDAATFVRTTLRHTDFMKGWKHLIELNMTDEEPLYPTDGKSLADVFKMHLDKNNFTQWLRDRMSHDLGASGPLLKQLTRLLEEESAAREKGIDPPTSFLVAGPGGQLTEIGVENMKNQAAGLVASQMEQANLTLRQLSFLGLADHGTRVDRGLCSAADILQFAMEKKMSIGPHDRDMIVMLHEIGYSLEGKASAIKSSLVIKGEDGLRTAMAKTVGLPLGIAAKLLLRNELNCRGLHIPIIPEIYEPVLAELEKNGVAFSEVESN